MFGSNAFDKKILKLIDQDEKHDKNNVVSSLELLKMMRNRFILMQDILKPLFDVLSKEILITNIYFGAELEDDFTINIDFVKDNQRGTIILNQFTEGEIEIVVNSHKDVLNDLIMDNKKIITDIFNHGLSESFDRTAELINSTSNILLLSMNNNSLEFNNGDVRNTLEHFKLTFNLTKDELMDNYKLITNLKNVEDKLKQKDNMNSFLEHVKVYEKSIPYYLTNRK